MTEEEKRRGDLPKLTPSGIRDAYQEGRGGSAILDLEQHGYSGFAAARHLEQTGQLSEEDLQAYQEGQLD